MGIEQELMSLRTPLLRFAQLQLRDSAAAEDVVSETMLAILQKPAAFGGESSLRTYATGILKHKMVDFLRKRSRELPIQTQEEQSIDEAIDALFREDGHWQERPASWREPEQALEQRQLNAVMHDCIGRLPARLARLIMMREWMEMEVAAICEELGINANHCGVLLYRARMQLRRCLEVHWFRERA